MEPPYALKNKFSNDIKTHTTHLMDKNSKEPKDQIVDHLLSFYRPDGKTILVIGAAGGGLAPFAAKAESIFAVDTDGSGLEKFRKSIKDLNFKGRCSCVTADFYETVIETDVAYFEFSLHEMFDPMRALEHACGCASDIIIVEHLPESPWVLVTGETEKVKTAWNAIMSSHPLKIKKINITKKYANHDELYNKYSHADDLFFSNIEQFKKRTNFTIRMGVGMVLLKPT